MRWRKRAGAVRVLGYDNREQGGNYAEALALAAQTGATPNVILTEHVGTLKYGTGVSFDQAITNDLGLFIRLGWNDGKTQSFAFTAIDRLASGGVSLKGTHWKRRGRCDRDFVHGRRTVRRAPANIWRPAERIF